MKSATEKSNRKRAFTIVEILTVMSIIVILITLLVPSLNMARRYAKNVRQRAQFHSIDVALDLFNADWLGYPPSDANDETNESYCGAMKLCEAMVGQDLLGFHPDSRFRCDGTLDGTPATQLYPNESALPPAMYRENLKTRKGPYLQLENANAYKLKYIYGEGETGPFDPLGEEKFVLCDIYNNIALRAPAGETIRGKCGMPILYYKANTSKMSHDPNNPGNPDNIYNYTDNAELVRLGLPWENPPRTSTHPLYQDPTLAIDWQKFYLSTRDKKIITTIRPYRADSYILLSAGFDGLYGTPDDIYSFGE